MGEKYGSGQSWVSGVRNEGGRLGGSVEGAEGTENPSPIPQVACMQFINIVVHSVENMNFRVFLQYEFTHLGLDLYLEVSPVLSPGLNCLPSGWQHGCWGQAGLGSNPGSVTS